MSPEQMNQLVNEQVRWTVLSHGVQMASKLENMLGTLSCQGKWHIEMTRRFHLTPARTATMRKQVLVMRALIHCWWKCKQVQ